MRKFLLPVLGLVSGFWAQNISAQISGGCFFIGNDSPGSSCDSTSSCASTAAIHRGSLDPLMPGFFLPLSGRSVVASVIPGSPAAGAGVAPGDEIASVDGRPPYLLCALEENPWQVPGQHILAVRRGGAVIQLHLTPEPLSKILASAVNRAPFAPTAAAPGKQAVVPTDPFVSGVIGSIDREGVFAEGVLRESPADRAGIRAGDRIVAVDGLDPCAGGTSLARVAGADSSLLIRMVVQRGSERREIKIRLAPISAILRRLADKELGNVRTELSADEGAQP